MNETSTRSAQTEQTRHLVCEFYRIAAGAGATPWQPPPA
jgi:hypothetical protein